MFLSHEERNLIIIIPMQITIVYDEHNMQFEVVPDHEEFRILEQRNGIAVR